MAGGYIKIYNKILSWEWYKNTNVKVLFIHLLLKANYKDMYFQGHLIKRGQLVTSLASLSAELGLTIRQVRGSLEHLISTGEVASSSTSRYRIITVLHYDEYQTEGKQTGKQTTNKTPEERQAEGKQTASERATSTYNTEYTDNTDNTEYMGAKAPTRTRRFIRPTLEEVEAYCRERKNNVNANRWYNYYSSNGWKVGKNPMKDWKAAVRTWEEDAYGNNSGTDGSSESPKSKWSEIGEQLVL